MRMRFCLPMAAVLTIACLMAVPCVPASVLSYDVEFVATSGLPGLQGWFSIDDDDSLEPIFGNVTGRTFADFAFTTAAGELFAPDDAASLDRAFYVDGLIAGLDVLMDDVTAPLGDDAHLDIATGFECQGQVCTVIGFMWALDSDRESGAGSYRFTLRVPGPASATLTCLAILMIAGQWKRKRGR